MGKRASAAGLACLLALLAGCCAGPVPLSLPRNCLNTYNSHWDDFAGRIEVGETYRYGNRGFDLGLRFSVAEILEDGRVLVQRPEKSGWFQDEHQKICEGCTFLILTSVAYADGARLRDGDYRCVGTWKHTTRLGEEKTIYGFADLAHPWQETGEDEDDEEYENEGGGRGRAGTEAGGPAPDPGDCLNFCNTSLDAFKGTLEVGRSYAYTNATEDESLRFRIMQAFPEVGALVHRDSARRQGREVCRECFFLVVSAFAYADGALLRDGSYRCLGTWRYETVDRATKTVYVLLDEENPRTLQEEELEGISRRKMDSEI